MCNYAQKLEEIFQYGEARRTASLLAQHWIVGSKIWMNEKTMSHILHFLATQFHMSYPGLKKLVFGNYFWKCEMTRLVLFPSIHIPLRVTCCCTNALHLTIPCDCPSSWPAEEAPTLKDCTCTHGDCSLSATFYSSLLLTSSWPQNIETDHSLGPSVLPAHPRSRSQRSLSQAQDLK